MSELTEACDNVLKLMDDYCYNTPCIKCVLEKELGTCGYEKLEQIFKLIKGNEKW